MLSDAACRKAKPREVDYRLADEKGLYLLVMRSGHRSWRMGYWFATKKKRLVLGAYPDMSLADARAARDEARQLLVQGVDPALRKMQLAASRLADSQATFKVVAERFLAERKLGWSKTYARGVESAFRTHLYPQWGALPFSAITRPMIAERLRAIEALGVLETASRTRQKVNELREWALDLGYEVHSPGKVNAGLRTAVSFKRPAITDLTRLRDMLRTIEEAPAHPVTRICSRFMALTAMRPGTVQQMPWGELMDLDGGDPLWLIPAARMKLSKARKAMQEFDHVVPLARQSVELLNVVRSISGASAFVFPSTKTLRRPISDSTISKLYRDNGFRDVHVPHGWRASFSTVMNERAMKAKSPGDRVVIDLMLAHIQEGIEPIYNRSAYMERRRELAQEWADLLLEDMPPAAALLDGPRS